LKSRVPLRNYKKYGIEIYGIEIIKNSEVERRDRTSRGYTREVYLGKCEVSMGKMAFSLVTDFTLGKFTSLIFVVK